MAPSLLGIDWLDIPWNHLKPLFGKTISPNHPFHLLSDEQFFTEVIVRFSLSHFCGEVTIEEPTPTLLSRVVLNSVYASAVNHQPEKARPVAGNDCKVCINMCHGRCWLPQLVSFWRYMKILSQSLMLSAFGIVLSLTTGFPGSLNQLLLGPFVWGMRKHVWLKNHVWSGAARKISAKDLTKPICSIL